MLYCIELNRIKMSRPNIKRVVKIKPQVFAKKNLKKLKILLSDMKKKTFFFTENAIHNCK